MTKFYERVISYHSSDPSNVVLLKPGVNYIPTGDGYINIHVIDYKAYEPLKEEVKKLKNILREIDALNYAQGVTLGSPNYFKVRELCSVIWVE